MCRVWQAQSDVLDEEAERRAFQAAVMDWRRGPVTAAAPAAASPAQKPAAKVAASASTGMASRAPASPLRAAGGGGGAMLNGALDEEREHAVRLSAYCTVTCFGAAGIDSRSLLAVTLQVAM